LLWNGCNGKRRTPFELEAFPKGPDIGAIEGELVDTVNDLTESAEFLNVPWVYKIK